MADFDAFAEAFGYHLTRAWPRGARHQAVGPGRQAWLLESAAGPFLVALWAAVPDDADGRAFTKHFAADQDPEAALLVWLTDPRPDGGSGLLVPGAPGWIYTPAERRLVRENGAHPLAGVVAGALSAATDDLTAPFAPAQAQKQPARRGLLASLKEAPVTYGLMGLITGIFALEGLWGGSTSPATLIRMGANMRELVAAGEWWRLVSANFLHLGFMHWAVNTYSLYAVGPAMEAFFGPFRFWAVFLASGVAGAAASAAAHPHGLSVGASGAIFGVIGAMLALGLRHDPGILPFQKRAMRQVVLSTLAINMVLAFAIQGLDHFAHAGGFLTGCLLAALMGPSAAWGGPRRRPFFWGIGIAASLIAGGALLYAIALAPWRGLP